MVNAVQQRWGEQFWTFAGAETAIDHVLVSKTIANEGLLAAGVLQGEPLNRSDHRMVCIAIDPSPWLRIGADAKMPRKRRKMRVPKLQLKGADKIGSQVSIFQQKLVADWEAAGMTQRVRDLEALVLTRKKEGVEWGKDDMDLQRL